MARPPRADTVQFRRKLDRPKLQILLTAGQGNISEGFENLLAIYQHLHSIGYTTDSPYETIGLVTNLAEVNEQPLVDVPIGKDRRDNIRIDRLDSWLENEDKVT